jgi:hypothetical protein
MEARLAGFFAFTCTLSYTRVTPALASSEKTTPLPEPILSVSVPAPVKMRIQFAQVYRYKSRPTSPWSPYDSLQASAFG